jgi:hypothetical protein
VDGYVALSGSVDTHRDAGWNGYACWFEVDGTVVDSSPRGVNLDGDTSGASSNNCGSDAWVELTAGKYSITFKTYRIASGITLGAGAAYAVFTPFRG